MWLFPEDFTDDLPTLQVMAKIKAEQRSGGETVNAVVSKTTETHRT